MDSQINVEIALERLSHCSPDIFQHELQILIPQLTSSLEHSYKHPAQAVKVVCALFRQCLPHLQSFSAANTLIFDAALPAVRNILIEILQGMKEKLQEEGPSSEVIEITSSLLQVAVSLLENIELCIDFVKTREHLKSHEVHKILTNLGTIVLEALQHCFDSRQIYGQWFDDMSDVLGIVFQKTNELLLKFIDLVKDNIVFDCHVTDELTMLCEVLGYLSRIGKFAPCLGVRGTSATWKLYANVTTKFTIELQGYLLLEEPLGILAQEVMHMLQNVAEQGGEDKSMERSLKVASFLLRIIIKLCEQYSNDLQQCHSTLLELLLNLFRFSEQGFTLCGSRSPSSLIDRILIIGTDPLLLLILFSQEFHKEVLLSNKEDNPEARLLLLYAITRLLVTSSPETRRMWLNVESSSSIFFLLSSALDQCQDKIFSNLENSGCDFYKKILIACTSLVAVLSSDEVKILETILFENLIQQLGGFQSLFICDLWIIVVRISGQAFCSNHLEFLTKVCHQLSMGQHKTIFINLLHRLLSLMPAKHRPTTEAITQLQYRRNLTSDDVVSVAKVLTSFVNTTPTSSLYKNVLQVLDNISFCTPETLEPVIPILIQLWNFIDQSRLGILLASKLLTVTSGVILQLNNEQMCSIIRHFSNFTNQSLKIQCLSILSKLSKQTLVTDDYQQHIFDCIANAYTTLLQDSDNAIQLAALQSFDEFAHFTKHEIIVSQAVSNSKDLQKMVSNYLQSKPEACSFHFNYLLCYRQFFAVNFTVESLEIEDEEGNINQLRNDVQNVNMSHDHIESECSDVSNPETVKNVKDLLVELDTTADSLLNLNRLSLLGPNDLLQVERIVNKLNNICSPFHS